MQIGRYCRALCGSPVYIHTCSRTRVLARYISARLKGKKRRRRDGLEERRKGADSTDANSPTKTECIKPKAQPARGTICISVLAAASIATAKHVPRHPIKGLATLCFLLPGVTPRAPRDIVKNSSSDIVYFTVIRITALRSGINIMLI